MLNEGPLTGSGGSGRNDLLGRLAVAEPDHSNVRFGSKADTRPMTSVLGGKRTLTTERRGLLATACYGLASLLRH